MSITNHRFVSRSRFPWLCGLLVFAFGCGAEDVVTSDPAIPMAEERPDEPLEYQPPATPTESYQTTISGFTFTVPAGWREVQLTPDQQGFIDARFEIPAAGEDVSLTLSTVGGGVQANVDRWIGQFTLSEGVTPEIETLTIDGIDVTWVELRGAFGGSGGPFAGGSPPQTGWMMLGVAFEGEPRDFYLKLTGPAEAVDDLKADFRGFVESARAQ